MAIFLIVAVLILLGVVLIVVWFDRADRTAEGKRKPLFIIGGAILGLVLSILVSGYLLGTIEAFHVPGGLFCIGVFLLIALIFGGLIGAALSD